MLLSHTFIFIYILYIYTYYYANDEHQKSCLNIWCPELPHIRTCIHALCFAFVKRSRSGNCPRHLMSQGKYMPGVARDYKTAWITLSRPSGYTLLSAELNLKRTFFSSVQPSVPALCCHNRDGWLFVAHRGQNDCRKRGNADKVPFEVLLSWQWENSKVCLSLNPKHKVQTMMK